MEISKKIHKRLTLITAIIIPIFIIIIIFLITYSTNKISGFTTTSHYHQIIDDVQSYSNILRTITEHVADDKKIINFLDKNLTMQNINPQDFRILKNQIALYEDILHPITYIKTINIISLSGQYLFSNGELFKDFNMTKRPWFKEEYLNNYKAPIISSVHKDYTTDEYAISLIKFIYSDNTGAPSGIVILDIFIEDLLESMDKSFHLGSLNSYIDKGNGIYLSKDKECTWDEIAAQNAFIYKGTILDNKIDIVFAFDKSSLIYSKYMKQVTNTTILILISMGCILSLTLVRFMKFTIKPLMNSLDHLKILLKNLEKLFQ